MATKRDRTVGNKVLAYFVQHKNLEVNLDDIEADLQIHRGQITSAISNLRRRCDITSPRKGWYLYHGELREENSSHAVSVKAKAQIVSVLEGDRLLVEVEGYLYLAKPLEVD